MSISYFIIFQILLVITVFYNVKVYQVDIVVVFLNGNLDKEIYMEVSDGFQKFAPSEFSRHH